MPVQHGESVVMRILRLDEAVRNLDQVGMNPETIKHFRHADQKTTRADISDRPNG